MNISSVTGGSELRASDEQRDRAAAEIRDHFAAGGLVPFLVCTAISLTSAAHGEFWPAWVALFAVVPLLRNGWRLYGPAPELDRVEAALARRRERAERDASRLGRRRLDPWTR